MSLVSLVPSHSLSLSSEREVHKGPGDGFACRSVSFGDVMKFRAKLSKREGNAWVLGWSLVFDISYTYE